MVSMKTYESSKWNENSRNSFQFNGNYVSKLIWLMVFWVKEKIMKKYCWRTLYENTRNKVERIALPGMLNIQESSYSHLNCWSEKEREQTWAWLRNKELPGCQSGMVKLFSSCEKTGSLVHHDTINNNAFVYPTNNGRFRVFFSATDTNSIFLKLETQIIWRMRLLFIFNLTFLFMLFQSGQFTSDSSCQRETPLFWRGKTRS